MRRVGVILGAVVIALLVIGGAALLVLSRTDVGRERARRIAVSMLQARVNGIVRVGRVSGNLLTGATVHDFAITDSAGAPFIVAKRATARYQVLDFLGRRVRLADVELVEPLIVLDRPPGGEWNYVRLFARETTGGTPVDTAPGWGDWISARNVTIVDGHLIVRSPWEPEAVGVAEREREIEQALAGAFRSHFVRGTGGLQRVAEFRDIHARLPRVRFADPKDTTKLVEVASLRTIAEAFNPPAADVRDLRGTFEFTSDSVWWADAEAKLPGSRISGNGSYEPDSRTLRLDLRGQPAALADLRWLYPRLPSTGQGTLDFEMLMEGEADRATYRARGADIRVGRASTAGDFGITVVGDSFTFHDTNLRFAGVGTRLIEQLAPQVRIPRQGSFAGRGTIAGGLGALAIDADVTFDDVAFGRSRVAAVGEIGALPTWRAEGLRLRLDPVQVALIRAAAPTFPIGGVIRGTATVDGSRTGWIATAADLVHEDGRERSRIVGRGEVRLAGERQVDLEVRATPLSLVTIGRLAPALELRGEVAGPVRLRGPLRAMAVRADMRVTGGGWLAVEGTLDLASAEKGYDLSAAARLFNAQSLIARLPQTSLTATATAEGRGLDPATMRLRLAADVATSTYDSLPVDSARVRLSVANGMATLDTIVLRAPSSRADARGTFGLAPGRGGALIYRVAIDSLSAYARWLPEADTGMVRPRPGTAARLIAGARADSARRAQASAVERASTGRAAPALLVLPDTPVVIPRDSLSGVVYAAGTLRGNIAQFDTRGRVGVERFVFRGSAARRARAEYALEHSGEEPLGIVLAAEVDSALAGGFALDSLDARLSLQGGRGTLAVVITQQPDDRDDREQQYTATGRFLLSEDRDELHLTSLALRFDTTMWRSTGEAALRWGGGRGLEVTNVDLRSGEAGRLYVNGLLPTEGVANLDVEVANFEISHLSALLQSDLDARGLISLDADITGTTRDLQLAGAIGVLRGAYRGTPLPELHATFRYAGQRLTASASASRAGGRPVVSAEGTIPLALMGREEGEPLFPDAPMSIDATIDSLPLEFLPRFTDAISNLRGLAIGRIAARGTVGSPRFAGAVAVREGEVRLDVLGVSVQQVAGTARMHGDSLVVDSISGVSGGPVRLTGGISLANLTRPAFALKLSATEARVLDNERGEARVNAEVTLDGPFEHAHVGGDITVLDAVIYIRESGRKTVIGPGDPALFTVLDTSLIADRELFPGQSSILANLSMDVTVTVNRDTWVRSPDANVEIYSDGPLRLHVDRAKQALALEGVVATELGQYTYLSRRFDIRRGSATFIGGESGLNPSLQITGEHRVQIPASTELRIQVVIGGTLDRPTLSLSSDAQPPLTQSDLLSFMAFGRSSASLLQVAGSSVGSAAGASSLQTVGAFAGQQLLGMSLGVAVDQLEGRAARSLGVDVFNITPADTYEEVLTADVGSYLKATELEVGRYFNPRTFGSLQARLSADAPPGLRIHHRFRKSYLIEGTFEPRYVLRQPSLSAPETTPVFGVFGAFLVREWKF